MQLSIVVPCYNEAAVLPETTRRLTGILQSLVDSGKVSSDSRIYYVDDGSSDATWHIIETLAASTPYVRGFKLSRNKGHQHALLAGLENAPGDALVSIDADLQDDVTVIETMVDRFKEGNDVVYGVRCSRDADSFFKRFTAEAYYRLLQRMGVYVVFNHADYRLLSRRALDALRQFGEVNLFLRGVIPQIGFKCCQVPYARGDRFAGESKYPLRRMVSLAVDGITSFSAAPLRLITGTGILISIFSVGLGLWALWTRLFTDSAIPGWASTVVPFYLLGGVQLLCIGVIGEYLAKIYLETKRRPRYFIDRDC